MKVKIFFDKDEVEFKAYILEHFLELGKELSKKGFLADITVENDIKSFLEAKNAEARKKMKL